MTERLDSGGEREPPKSPARQRTEILTQKRSSELQYKFRNRELALRFEKASAFDKFIIGGGVVVLLVPLLILLLLGGTIPGANPTGANIVFGIIIVASLALIGLGIFLRKKRESLFTKAAFQVLREEPHPRLLQVVVDQDGNEFLMLKEHDSDTPRRWRIGLELGNPHLVSDHPEILKGITAEVYIEAGSEKPLGMFVDDHVYWFI